MAPAKETGRGGERARADIDPWSAFFEDLWGEAAESGSADRSGGGSGGIALFDQIS